MEPPAWPILLLICFEPSNSEAHEKALLNGNRLDPAWGCGTAAPERPVVVKDSSGRIKALYRFDEEDKMLHPDVMLL